MNSEDGNAHREFVEQKVMVMTIGEIVVGHLGDGCGSRHLGDVDQRRQNHACLNGNREVGEYSEGKRDAPYRDICRRQAKDLRDFRPLAHVVGDHH